MSLLDGAGRRAWLAYWRTQEIYHRYTVEGLERLTGPDVKPSLIVGYHGTGPSVHMCLLTVKIYDCLNYLPCAIVHQRVDHLPPLKWLRKELGFVTKGGEEIREAVARGRHIFVTPGGGREALRSFRSRYQVDFGDRMGYAKLAVEHGLPIVPVGASGVDETYLGLNDGTSVGRVLGLPRDIQALPWIGVGPIGVFPFSPPFPVRIRQIVGEPIPVAGIDAGDESQLQNLHASVQSAVQELVKRARGRVFHPEEES
jgi:hypothetical protein